MLRQSGICATWRSDALALLGSSVSNPSVNQPQIGARRSVRVGGHRTEATRKNAFVGSGARGSIYLIAFFRTVSSISLPFVSSIHAL